MNALPSLDLTSLATMYRTGEAKPSEIIAAIYDRICTGPREPVWISLVHREAALKQARELEESSSAFEKPLYGIPFAIKDNIDLQGVPTTAGCPAYSYLPERSATVVSLLMEAGAIPIGKTNLDQFATGLVGMRSPYGACSSVFGERYISGGSSSGSAVAVAKGLVSFALGTDTAGSGRVPAAFNNLVGLKPTRGVLSTSGVVPACRTLDCVSIFAATSGDARAVWEVVSKYDAADPFSRPLLPGAGASPWLRGPFRFGVPGDDQLEFFGDEEAAHLFRNAVRQLERLGGHKVVIDFSLFRAAADLLYSGPWVAERYTAIRDFVDAHAGDMHPVVRGIIEGARRYSAVDTFAAEYKLRELHRLTEAEWAGMDVMLLPTTPTIYTKEAVAADPVRLNSNLGYYTNFVNLLDLAAVAVPAGFRTSGTPFGISLIGRAFTEEALLELADRYHRASAEVAGEAIGPSMCPPGCVALAVVGAHLSGQPLNWQLTQRGARLLETIRTGTGYRLYVLSGTKPQKPGLVRDPSYEGLGIEVELWAIPENQFGSFVNDVPAPLGIGNANLENGASVKCFICEPYAIEDAREISHLGSWRAYLAGSRQKV